MMDETERYHEESKAERMRAEGFDRVDDVDGTPRDLTEVFGEGPDHTFPFNPWERDETVGE